ncbi:transcriptional regulator, ArsR family [Pyrobaculum islandicum DSM 4184]|uniref:Transcriptional regulator, ArsR family n=1 Tax=Pyrobaculum islandicum (strain DSM 4184 / JCM 9189 / GEO3) TaxID=384616 RepID=A1RSV2_PYRIL|nr:transcriptional regulator, ArsR family [Pyrobaculum islandicum DSM 4184]
MLLLHREGPMTLTKLRTSLNISASVLLFELSALENLGVVKREESLVRLTDLGEKVASIISTLEPLKSLTLPPTASLRPLVIWLLLSPHLHITTLVILTTWILALIVGALQNPPLTLFGVTYVGYYLPLSIRLSIYHSLAISLSSIAVIILTTYILSRKRIKPLKTIVGVIPLALYPSTHLTLVQIAYSLEFVYLITLSQILLFLTLLLTATMYATMYSLEVGTTYEQTLIHALIVFFVIPALLYMIPIR